MAVQSGAQPVGEYGEFRPHTQVDQPTPGPNRLAAGWYTVGFTLGFDPELAIRAGERVTAASFAARPR
jgi:hypothetical protein